MSIYMILAVIMIIAFIIFPRFRKIILVFCLLAFLICAGVISFT